MVRHAFRLHRWAMIIYGAGLGLMALYVGTTYSVIAGTGPAARAAFAKQMEILGPQFSYLIPLPHQPETLAGYVLWKAWDAFPILMAIWAIAAAAGAVRGDEEKGLVESWLAAGVSRTRLVVSRLAAFALAAAVVAALAGIGTVLGAARTEPVPLAHAAGQSLVLWLLTVALFALCVLVAQIPASKTAAQGAGAVVMLVLFVIASAARGNHALDGISWISPFHWFEVSYPLAPAGHLDVLGLALCVITVVVAGGLAALLFRIRDVGGAVVRIRLPERPSRPRDPSPLLQWPVARLIYRRHWTFVIWTAATVAVAVYMVGVFKQAIDSLLRIPGAREFVTRGTSDPYQGFIAVFWFGLAQLLIAGFAIHLVSTWSSDDGEGVLTAELSRPRHRWAVVVERFFEALAGIVAIAVLGSLAAYLATRGLGTTLDAAGTARAAVLLIPFALTFSAVGAVGSVWWPRASVGVLGSVVFLSYLVNNLGPLLKWPTWAVDISPFSLYGTPLLTGVYWNGLFIMVAVVVAGFLVAALLMQRRELAE
jgi:ABC-2 type transport system permease protein